jgi:anaerobic ribonucleoside-triphosphate reductase activating protein
MANVIRLAGPIERDNIVNGPGLRAVIWTQGCYRHCPGCQNPETWDPKAGVEVTVDEVKEKLASFRGQTGLTFCGGEPMLQALVCKEIADWARKELGWDVWSFTGYVYEDILAGRDYANVEMVDFIKSLDALIDGPFILAERDLSVKWRGSRNQRILYLQKGEIVNVE